MSGSDAVGWTLIAAGLIAIATCFWLLGSYEMTGARRHFDRVIGGAKLFWLLVELRVRKWVARRRQ